MEDKAAWLSHIVNVGDVRLKRFFEVCETLENGTRTTWALNLMQRFLSLIGATMATTAALAEIMSSCSSRSLQCKALRVLRRMLETDPSLAHILAAMPLHWRREPADQGVV